MNKDGWLAPAEVAFECQLLGQQLKSPIVATLP